jgi:hypothetical protein
MPLPPLGSDEWQLEVARYLQSTIVERKARAAELGYTYKSFRTAMAEREVYLTEPSPFPRYDEPVVVTEPVLCLFDAQVPYHDYEFIEKLLQLAYSWGIKKGISGGDFFNQTAFSRFSDKPEHEIWSVERKSAYGMLRAMRSSLPEWVLVKGNHDSYIIKMLENQISHQDVLSIVGLNKGFIATDYYYCIVDLAGVKWRISHPRNISVIHARVPSRLCHKYKMNVVSGHGHLVGQAYDDSGTYLGVDAGVVCDPMRLDYYAERDNTRPAMNQGAVIITVGLDGKSHCYTLTPQSDFKALSKLYNRTS